MDTNRLKKFAIEARNILKAGIAAKLTSLGFDSKGGVAENLRPQLLQGGTLWNGRTLSEGFYHQWMRLYEEVQAKGVNEVYEQAAYTWFNRLVAIRILQKNGLCEPVSTYADSAHTPQIVNQARQGLFPPMEEASKRHLLELLDDDTKVTEQFAVLLVAWCHANPILQRCFGTMEDYTELLLPANILAENGFIDLLNHTEFITDEEFCSPELIGWLYQFYISERKDEVFAKKGKFEADEIPAATQIFTPNWIVKYMVQNTVGRIYLDNNPYTTLAYKEKWQYLVEPAEPTPAEAILHYNELTDLKVADLACGSGHILNECFDLLYDLYITEGYTRVEAITHIFQDNLTGIDLDPRAQQLSLFALTLKACQRDHSFVDAHCLPRVLTMPKVQLLPLPADTRLAVEIDAVNTLLKDADSLGSIMKFDLTPAAREWVVSRAEENEAAALVIALTEQYDALVMNPPYMGSGRFSDILSEYAKSKYPISKSDLFAIFIERMLQMSKSKGRIASITMESWMFLSSYKNLRKLIISNYSIQSLIHMPYLGKGWTPLGIAFGTSAFVIENSVANDIFTGDYQYIRYYETVKDNGAPPIKFPTINERSQRTSQYNYTKLPGNIIGYWLSDNFVRSFSQPLIGSVLITREGMATADNDRFLRLWYEVSVTSFSKMNKLSDKWYPYNKGGAFRRWFGNREYIVDWSNNGYDIKNNVDPITKRIRSHNYNGEFAFRECLTWSALSSGKISLRYCEDGFLWDSKGACGFSNQNLIFCLGLLNSIVARKYLEFLSATKDFKVGDIIRIPFNFHDNIKIENIINNCINISKLDWNAHETSWDFHQNELISLIGTSIAKLKDAEVLIAQCGSTATLMQQHFNGGTVNLQAKNCHEAVRIEELMGKFKIKWETLFMQLHTNEEELNRQFIDIYGLQDELTPDVPLNEITILQQGEVSIEGNALKWRDEVILKQLLSYAAGVWMGRYCLDKSGLHIAHPNPTVEELAPYTYNGHIIEIDDDGIFPLMAADSGFTDNACLRTAQFVSDVFGVEYQVENLNYIEHTLGKTIEQYWQKDFWKEHKKMYQNRPIYWLFASKKGTFQCIAYLHRMTPYTPERIRSKYLLPFIETLGRKIADLTTRAADLSTAERKKLDTLNKQLEECREYHDRLAVVAEQAIPLDLDDGVVVNYAKLGDVVAKLK